MKKPIAYLKLNHVLLCSAIGFTSLNAMAESTNNAINETLSVLRTNQGNLTIKGTISDKTGPIIGANVIIKGTTNGVITDIDGNFTLENVKKGDILQVSFIGYSTKEIKISNNNNLHIQLDEDTQSLEEVVVVGYGSQRKSDLTGGVTAVGEDKLGLVSTNNLMDKLAGQIPGLNISTGNAQPGEDQTLRIRGNNSLTASNDPLIVMDGIPYSGSLGDIDPDIIESMSVLKDASSAAIYGSRGSNGVILIQTKKGRQGKATVTYKGQVGMAETERRLDMMSGDEYLQYLYDYNHLKNGIPYDQLTPESVLGADELANYKAGRTIDWQDKMFRQALVTNHQISLTGGTESTTYMASISRLRQDGVVRNTGMKRTNISLNINQNLGKWLKIGMSMQAIQKEYGGELPYLEAGLKMSPFGTYSDEEGNLEYYPMSRNTLFYNPMSDCDAIEDKTNRNVFISTFADITLPVKGLSFRTNFGYNYRNNFVGTYYGRNTLTGSKVDGAASIENTHYWDYTWENILKYENTFGKHKIDATGLFSIQETSKQYSKQSAESFVNDEGGYHNMAGGEKNKSLSSSLTETALLSYMIRLNYAYAGKYLLTLTGRSDGYSAFGANNKYAFFPSAAAAWNISSEEFMENTRNWLDMMKLRVSYGANGNQGINAYQTLDRLSLTQYIWGDGGNTVNGVYLPTNGVGNPNLKWETTYTFNTGIDFGLFNGRLSGNIDFYIANTKDLLMNRTVPYMNGYRSILDNIGQTRNVGVEFALNSINIETKDFLWKTNVNFSLNRDKIIKLQENGKDDITNKWFIGEPTNVYYDYNVIGTWQTDDPRWKCLVEKDNAGNIISEKWGYYTDDWKEIQKGAEPGSAKLEDVDGDGVITADDKKIIGSKLPSFLMSMTNNFTYKDFYMSFVLNGVFGQWRQMHDQNFDRWMPEFNYLSGMNYWTESNPTNEMTSPSYVPYEKHSFYKKMNYVQLKNITIGYNIPKTFTQKLGITSARVDVSVNNVCTFSNIKNALNYDNAKANDDEKGVVVGYPTARSYMLGLNVTF
ncbi:TonB-linked outer membrane protein, SusC/RagA family [Phocaeicola plebeius DSM 17135]|uniref:TonB-linked outer membrane protein, SusC/RagA family n=1 Tax=Phocaeicola plebeius (strain DSM 17135 / JCM 12973 / CCUG 54634 / M2) TaxID=484018 RepID=B5D3T7_PHOPM|nr:TonB-dependent receptor [Phocaeicola plebeius]EDY94237.1 TonB-linked outer membrane protein, SusC/RagA family [Phocaeicola plebeius DSM 17135]